MRKILSIVLSLVMLLSLGAFAQEAFTDGVYEGEGEGMMGAIKAVVTVKGGQITDIQILEHEETPGIADPALKEVPEAIIQTQSTEVDVIAGATYTSEGIMQAVEDALFEELELQDGTYEGEGAGMMGPIKVSVTVSDGKITEILVLSHDETPGISDPALKEIPEAIVNLQSTEVDVVAGATYTSEGIMEAVENALPADESFADGSYEGEGKGMMGDMKVAVTVMDGRITDIQILEHEETPGIADPALNEIPALIIEAQSTQIDAIAGATYTSEGILEAVENALAGEME